MQSLFRACQIETIELSTDDMLLISQFYIKHLRWETADMESSTNTGADAAQSSANCDNQPGSSTRANNNQAGPSKKPRTQSGQNQESLTEYLLQNLSHKK